MIDSKSSTITDAVDMSCSTGDASEEARSAAKQRQNMESPKDEVPVTVLRTQTQVILTLGVQWSTRQTR